MDFGKSFTFMFEDPEWLRKLGIGTLVGLVGFIFLFVLIGLIPLIMLAGYTLDVVRNVMDHKTYPLPEWEDWGGFLARGLKLIVAFIIWLLPAFLVVIPLGIGSTWMDNNGQSLGAIGGLLVACSSCLLIIWALFVTLISPAIYVHLARTNRFSSAFELSSIWDFTRQNLANVIIAILLTWVAGLIASVVAGLGVIAIVVGLLITIPFANLWWYLVQAHLFGQIGALTTTPIE